jgi:hypothetical protein
MMLAHVVVLLVALEVCMGKTELDNARPIFLRLGNNENVRLPSSQPFLTFCQPKLPKSTPKVVFRFQEWRFETAILSDGSSA